MDRDDLQHPRSYRRPASAAALDLFAPIAAGALDLAELGTEVEVF